MDRILEAYYVRCDNDYYGETLNSDKSSSHTKSNNIIMTVWALELNSTFFCYWWNIRKPWHPLWQHPVEGKVLYTRGSGNITTTVRPLGQKMPLHKFRISSRFMLQAKHCYRDPFILF